MNSKEAGIPSVMRKSYFQTGRSQHECIFICSDSASGDASSSSASSSAPELPGFYFDPEKNRYFRLLPGHNNCNPLTKEGLQKKEEEKKRSALLVEDDGPRKKAPRNGLNSALLLQKRHLGLLPPSSYSRLIHEVKVSGMQRQRLEVQSSNSTSPNTDNFHLIVADSACERVFTVNDVSHGGCKYGIMNFHGYRKGFLSVEMCDNLYFTNRKAPVLFNGCRSGEIFSIDLRQRDRGRSHSWKTSRFFQESAITSVQLLQDENYLLAADMLGKIKLWDIRIKRSVKQYEGHHNEYAYLPIHVNEPEGLLLAVGQDCYTRLWSLHDSRLLRTIPSPHPAGKDSIPNVVFSSQLGGSRGLPGLLMAVRHDLYHYSYNKDYQEGRTLEGQC
ncbi:hypothetical protein cypCar_00004918 [Cyprinus carpio]|nr:hypothetical protein cypCar_00004918 [Cyprinus carpio]